MFHLVVAMACEARPLIRKFGLQAASEERAFRVYETAGCSLVVSGVGKTAAAAATAYLAARGGPRAQAWLNVGVAGHRSLDGGRGVLAHKIVDGATGRSWYPPQLVGGSCGRSVLISVDEVESEYREEAAYDMEAAAFWPTAVRFSTAELVQSFKVVSDNPREPSSRLDADSIEALIEGQIETVGDLASRLEALAATLPEGPDLEPFLERWRLSVTQQRRLSRLLTRLAALSPQAQRHSFVAGLVDDLESGSTTSGGEVLRRLEELIESLPVGSY